MRVKRNEEFQDRERASKEIWKTGLGTGRDLEAELVKTGAPIQKAGVRSVFDTRPINASDWLITDGYISVGATGETFLSFTVPTGKVAVIREIKWMFVNTAVVGGTTVYVFPDTSAFISGVTLQINEGTPDGFSKTNPTFYVGARPTLFGNGGVEKVHVIAGDSATISLQVFCDAAVFPYSAAYGRLVVNMLESDGLAANLQVGNIEK